MWWQTLSNRPAPGSNISARNGAILTLSLFASGCTASFTNPGGDVVVVQPSGTWSTARLEGEYRCTPGQRVTVSCGACNIGS